MLSSEIMYLNSKFKFIDHLVRKIPPDKDNKLIIVSYFKSTLKLVEKYFRSVKIKFVTLSGELSAQVRDENVKKFLNTDHGS